jgi:hypothetical protein
MPYTLSAKLSDFTVWPHTWWKNWVNYAVSTGNSAGPRNVLSSRLIHRKLRSLLKEYQSLLRLPADTTMASSVSNNSFSKWAPRDIFRFKDHFVLHILPFIFFFSDNIMADVASKQQTTVLFLSTTVTRTRRHTERTKTLTTLMGNLCLAREHSVQFIAQICYTDKLHSLT